MSAGFGAVFVMALFYLAGKVRKAVVGCCGRATRKEPKIACKKRRITSHDQQPTIEVEEAEEALLSQEGFTVQASPKGSGLYIRRAYSSPALRRVTTADDLFVSESQDTERDRNPEVLPAPP